MKLLLLMATAIISFFSPVTGLTIYLLAWTGFVGLFEKIGILGLALGQLRPDNFALLGALAALAIRRSKAKSFDIVDIFIFILTGAIFISLLNKPDMNPQGGSLILKSAFFSLFFLPLYIAFKKLTAAERANFKLVVIILSVMTTLIVVVVSITNNPLLYITFCMTEAIMRVKEIGGDSPSAPRELLLARVWVPGLWTIVPFGYWLNLKEILNLRKRLSLKLVLYGIGFFIMNLAILINLSRSAILAVITGSLTVYSLYVLKMRKLSKVFIVLIIIGGVTYSFVNLSGIYDRLLERVGDKSTIETRTLKTLFLKNILINEIPLFGMQSDQDEAVHGDAYTFIRIWWSYGFIAALAFYIILLIALIRLLTFLKYSMYLSMETFLMVICLLAYWVHLQWEMLSGTTLRPEWVFINMFFFSEIFFISSQLQGMGPGDGFVNTNMTVTR